MVPASHHVILRAKPGCGDALARLLDRLLDHMGRESGLLYFAVLRDPQDDDLLMLFEHWRDAQEYAQVLQRDWRQAYVRERDALLAAPPQVHRWRLLRREQR
jgi:quinol monooxygenase YgiN